MCVHSVLVIIAMYVCSCLFITYGGVFENKDFCSSATQMELAVQDLSFKLTIFALHGKKRPLLVQPHLSLFLLS